MRPITFKGSNATYAEHQPEYNAFPVHHTHNEQGELIGCWSLSFSERIRVLFTGRIWHSMWTFNKPLQPQRLTTRKSDCLY